jgi:hypothetical protein
MDHDYIGLKEEHGTITAAAEALGIPRTTFTDRLRQQEKHPEEPTIQIEPVPPELEGQELWDYVQHRRRRRLATVKARELRKVKVNDPGPIGLLVFGDPHLDDDYCDLDLVKCHLGFTHEDGVYGVCVGDFTNNWTGRLYREYANQGTTKTEGVSLIEEFIRMGNWIALGVQGNHDAWGKYDPVKFLAKQHDLVYHDWELRMELKFLGSKCPILVNIAHNHKGVSQWIRAFGSIKQATIHDRDDLYLCGHHHTSGIVRQMCGDRLVTAVRVGGYKGWDKHAIQHGFKDQRVSPSVLAILDPQRPPAGRVQVYEDLELGLQVLVSLRSRGR